MESSEVEDIKPIIPADDHATLENLSRPSPYSSRSRAAPPQAESSEAEDINPIIPTDDIPDKGVPAVPGIAKPQVKQSRYEDVWPEDVHAAFMEAVALYPPMGKRRLKYYRIPTTSRHEHEDPPDANRAKSFGRCQLIQSYILEKTGKNRSRKQVSSHLQRLKKIHKDNPAMSSLFLERSRSSPERYSIPPDIFANMISFDTPRIKSEFDLPVDLQDADVSADCPSTFVHASGAPSFDSSNVLDLSTNYHDQPLFFPQGFPPPQYMAGNLDASDGDYFPEFSISMRRLASRCIQGRQFELGPTTHISRPVHPPANQQTQPWISHDGSTDVISSDPPLAPAQQAFHMPLHPLQPTPTEKQLNSCPGSDWMWPHNPNTPLGIREDTFCEARARYPHASYRYNPTCPVNFPGTYSSPTENEDSRFSRGFSRPYAITNLTTISDWESPSKGCVPEQPMQESPEDFASSLLIKPTPVYPISYIHPRIYSDAPARSFFPY